MTTMYVVAASQSEADSIADDHGHFTESAAQHHLDLVLQPPTDPFYAAQYKIWKVRVK